MQRGNVTYSGHIAGKGKSSLAPDLTFLTHPIFPLHQTGTGSPLLPQTQPHPSPLLPPQILLKFMVARPLSCWEEGPGLSGLSQMYGPPQPGPASKFLHAEPKHNTI